MKIAIVKLSALGDIIFAMTALQFIKKNHPQTLIDWIVEERFTPVLHGNPDINQLYPVNLRQAKAKKSILLLAKELKKIRKLGVYDLVIDMQGLIKSALITKLIPSKKRIGFDQHSTRESFASWFYHQRFSIDYAQNIVIRNLSLVAFAFGFEFTQQQIDNKDSFLFAPNRSFSELSKDKKNILLVLGASFKSKQYPVEQYAKVIQAFDAHYIAIWGDESEHALAKQLKLLTPRLTIMQKISLSALITLVSQVDLVIGGDTGPTHLAWALNIPSITLFGPTPSHRNTYTTNINHIIESGAVINPRKIDKSDTSIMRIDSIEIVKMIVLLLNKKT